VVAALLGIGGIVLIGHYSPEYALDNLTARTSALQQVGRYHQLRGGSHFTLSGEIPTTLVGQLAYAPAALLASLFRPALFEVHNLLMLANAAETTVLTLLFARILFTRNLGNVRRQIADDPFLVFCLVFVVAFGIAVGLASTNLGTLSRYRCPLLPFFVVLLFVLGKPLSARSPASTRRRVPETALETA
jgi:branched-subunit amino acid transport protein